MILVDYRERPGRRDKAELLDRLRSVGMQCDKGDLEYGDVAFEGHGPKGKSLIGIERKRLHDMLNCIDSARFSAHQMVGLKNMYSFYFLLVEGMWKPHEPKGILMEGYGGDRWGALRYRSQEVLYSKLRRYLLSVQLSGVPVLYTRDTYQTAVDIKEVFHYFQKPWQKHTSLMALQQVALPTLAGKPTLLRRWAHELDGIGEVHSEAAENIFTSALDMALSSPEEWMQIHGIGRQTAESVVGQINRQLQRGKGWTKHERR